MLGLMKYAKLGGIWLASIVAVAMTVWTWRGCEKDAEWQARIQNAKPTTSIHIDTLYLPPPKPITGTANVYRWNRELSMVYEEAKLIAMERDSLRDVLHFMLEVKKIVIKSDKIGELIVTLLPSPNPLVADDATWVHYPPPPIEIVKTVTVEKEVIVENTGYVVSYVVGSFLTGLAAMYVYQRVK
jgi:hypothetical protein